jgi:uncharacterized protein
VSGAAGLPLPGMPAPAADELSLPFWEGLAAGEIRAPRCTACGRPHFPVLPACPFCGGREREWASVGEEARVFSWIVVRRGVAPGVPVPYTVVLAEFPGGVRIPGNLDGEAALRADAPLRAAVATRDGVDVVVYRAVADRG